MENEVTGTRGSGRGPQGCKGDDCYRFAPGTSERARCRAACWLGRRVIDDGLVRGQHFGSASICRALGIPEDTPPHKLTGICRRLVEDRDRLLGWLQVIDGGDMPVHDNDKIREWAFRALRGDEVFNG